MQITILHDSFHQRKWNGHVQSTGNMHPNYNTKQKKEVQTAREKKKKTVSTVQEDNLETHNKNLHLIQWSRAKWWRGGQT